VQTVITDAVRKGVDVDSYHMTWAQVGYTVGLLYGAFTGLWLSARRRLDGERRAEEVQDLGPGDWYTHRLPSRMLKRPGASPRETRPQGKDTATAPGVGEALSCRGFRPVGVADE
jgi:hypothetical protein